MNTKTCPQCGSAAISQARFCGQCGHTFVVGSADAVPAARRVATTVDEATADPPRTEPTPAPPLGPTPSAVAAGDASESGRGFAKTLVLGGTTAPAPAPAEVAPAPPAILHAAGSDKRTMLGMAAVGLPPRAPEPPASPQALASANKTMLGVAIPGIAPTHEKAPPAGGRAGTLLGIAVPGVAPTTGPAMGGFGPRWTPPQPEVPGPPVLPAPAPLLMEPLPEAPRGPAKRGVPAVAVAAIVFVVVAIAGAAAAILVMRSGAPLTARPQLDETGKESLAIHCKSCPDGTVVSLGASSAKVEGSAAVLPLPAPLAIGDNALEMGIDRPPPGRSETVEVHVPVAYRVKSDLSTLTAVPPSVTVRVEAAPGSDVTVDGEPVVLDATGKGAHAIDVSPEAFGPSDDAKAIDKKIAFAVTPKGASAPETGELVVRAAVVPLHIDAPGRELYTERTTGNVAGQTRPGATLTVDGQNVALDPDGRFAVRVNLPAEGEKTILVVANAPPLAPRTVQAKLVRVASLDVSAKLLDVERPLGFDAYGAEPTSKVGQLAVVDGELVEIRTGPGHTVMLVEEKATCPSGGGTCIVRVVHGEEISAARGDSIRAYGHIEGTVTSAGKSVPDVEGSLVMTRSAGKK